MWSTVTEMPQLHRLISHQQQHQQQHQRQHQKLRHLMQLPLRVQLHNQQHRRKHKDHDTHPDHHHKDAVLILQLVRERSNDHKLIRKDQYTHN
ncbi:hypothetical protein KSF78_0000233 [Schistosoma japonicum]|nr:hypothetical protein KSF78_0000233 [Schistosoma japonicum]KAH8849598.1 hypothetical protein KSF78_0000233 [Schistosoma japonicum]